MARGWESKSVESQQEMAAERRTRQVVLSAAEQARASQRRHLQLSLQRTVEQLQHAVIPRRREQLEAARAYLEDQIQQMKKADRLD